MSDDGAAPGSTGPQDVAVVAERVLPAEGPQGRGRWSPGAMVAMVFVAVAAVVGGVVLSAPSTPESETAASVQPEPSRDVGDGDVGQARSTDGGQPTTLSGLPVAAGRVNACDALKASLLDSGTTDRPTLERLVLETQPLILERFEGTDAWIERVPQPLPGPDQQAAAGGPKYQLVVSSALDDGCAGATRSWAGAPVVLRRSVESAPGRLVERFTPDGLGSSAFESPRSRPALTLVWTGGNAFSYPTYRVHRPEEGLTLTADGVPPGAVDAIAVADSGGVIVSGFDQPSEALWFASGDLDDEAIGVGLEAMAEIPGMATSIIATPIPGQSRFWLTRQGATSVVADLADAVGGHSVMSVEIPGELRPVGTYRGGLVLATRGGGSSGSIVHVGLDAVVRTVAVGHAMAVNDTHLVVDRCVERSSDCNHWTIVDLATSAEREIEPPANAGQWMRVDHPLIPTSSSPWRTLTADGLMVAAVGVDGFDEAGNRKTVSSELYVIDVSTGMATGLGRDARQAVWTRDDSTLVVVRPTSLELLDRTGDLIETIELALPPDRWLLAAG